ncbi:hypothetical protein BKA69DRAFT_1088264 [Paraphysoderma sedebokerense]|nr:hypothetical protein BKA69DRAFT_1088264 [Paraphysoderma sedebokerense]
MLLIVQDLSVCQVRTRGINKADTLQCAPVNLPTYADHGGPVANNDEFKNTPLTVPKAFVGKTIKKCSDDKKFCLTMIDGPTAVMFTLEGPRNLRKLGHIACGLGKAMSLSDVYVAWVNPETQNVVFRDGHIGFEKVDPTFDASPEAKLVVGTGGYNETTQRWSVSFVRDKKVDDAKPIDTSQPINMIWSLHETAVPVKGKLEHHTSKGLLLMDFNNQEQIAFASASTSSATNTYSQQNVLVMIFSIGLTIIMSKFLR